MRAALSQCAGSTVRGSGAKGYAKDVCIRHCLHSAGVTGPPLCASEEGRPFLGIRRGLSSETSRALAGMRSMLQAVGRALLRLSAAHSERSLLASLGTAAVTSEVPKGLVTVML